MAFCRWKLIVDTHKEFLFKPLCIANGWRSPLIVNIPEIREVREDTDSETGTEDAQSANQAQWSRIFITNYCGYHRSRRIFACSVDLRS